MTSKARMARIIQYLDTHFRDQPSLEVLAQLVELSPNHFHREFVRWVGITPKDFVQGLTLDHARRQLQLGQSVLDAALTSGLSGPGRLHDLCIHLAGATPGEIKNQGQGLTLRYGTADSPFGTCHVVTSKHGIAHLAFHNEGTTTPRPWIEAHWPAAEPVSDPAAAQQVVQAVFRPTANSTKTPPAPLRLWVRASRFQFTVWQALLQVPPNTLLTYGDLADSIGRPKAARAVGQAVGANPLAILIPCHRVIRNTGLVTGYRWGTGRKRALIAWENGLQRKN